MTIRRIYHKVALSHQTSYIRRTQEKKKTHTSTKIENRGSSKVEGRQQLAENLRHRKTLVTNIGGRHQLMQNIQHKKNRGSSSADGEPSNTGRTLVEIWTRADRTGIAKLPTIKLVFVSNSCLVLLHGSAIKDVPGTWCIITLSYRDRSSNPSTRLQAAEQSRAARKADCENQLWPTAARPTDRR